MHTVMISVKVHVGITRQYRASLALFSLLHYNWVLRMTESRDTCETDTDGPPFLVPAEALRNTLDLSSASKFLSSSFPARCSSCGKCAHGKRQQENLISRETNLVSHSVVASKPSTCVVYLWPTLVLPWKLSKDRIRWFRHTNELTNYDNLTTYDNLRQA